MEERWSIGLPPIFENGDDFSDKENLSPPRTPKEFSDPFLTLSPICIETTSTPLHSISANTPRSLGKVKWNGTCPFTPAEAQHRPPLDPWLKTRVENSPDQIQSPKSSFDSGSAVEFQWTIDDLACLMPVDIEVAPEQYMTPRHTPGQVKREQAKQEMIDRHFNKNLIVPSPNYPGNRRQPKPLLSPRELAKPRRLFESSSSTSSSSSSKEPKPPPLAKPARKQFRKNTQKDLKTDQARNDLSKKLELLKLDSIYI
eukprot:m.46664 g.46664  ORF g.46664 m.46664 type:complete len:256 (+) comp10394_c0_seq1:193-960(+)